MFKAYCVICPNKTRLEEKDDFLLVCPVCGNKYDKSYEMIAHDDELESAHEEESATLETGGLNAGGTGLLSAKDDDFQTLDEIMEQEHNRGKIAIPRYFKNGTVTTVEEFHEEID